MPACGRRSGGFALIIVLWTLVLIAFIVALLARNGRVEVKIAGNLAANAVTAAAADGAVYQAIFHLLEPASPARWPLDGAPHLLTIGECRVVVEVRDEAARINPNLAAASLLEVLLRVTGSDANSARRLATAIGEWVGLAGTARSRDALAAEYRAAGLDYAPPSAPLETVGELRRVLGMTPAVFSAIRPHLSLYAPSVPDPTHADPVVRAALAAFGQGEPPVARAAAQPEVYTARISAVASGPNKARAERTVIARVVPSSGAYTVLAWRHPD